MENWPNFFIVGAPKAGTTSLYRYLIQVPEIYMSPEKEPRYFNSATLAKVFKDPIRDKKQYLELFDNVKEQKAIGEASTSYLRDPETPARIHEVIPYARIIMILRDPVERAFSNYLMRVEKIATKLSFHEIITDPNLFENYPPPHGILDAGFYSDQVKRYIDTFGAQQVKILIFEEFIRDTKSNVKEILNFLGINNGICDFKEDVFNPFYVPRTRYARQIMNNTTIKKMAGNLISQSTRDYLREKFLIKRIPKPTMPEQDRIFLRNMYSDDVQKLRNILGRPLPWSNFNMSN